MTATGLDLKGEIMKFRTYVEPPEPMRGLEVPPEVVESLGQGKRPPVTITINGHSWKSRVAIMRGRYLLGLSNANRRAAGVKTGDEVEVEVEFDREPRIVVEPSDAFAHGRLKGTKTHRSTRAVPLQAIALEALERLPARTDTPLLFPAPRGGYLDLHNFRRRAWKPAQRGAGIEPLRRPYDLRHTFATFALRAGISTFDLSRFMGASLTMIDRHYGHLARDGREHAAALLDSLAEEEAVAAAWTFGGRRGQQPEGSTKAVQNAID